METPLDLARRGNHKAAITVLQGYAKVHFHNHVMRFCSLYSLRLSLLLIWG